MIFFLVSQADLAMIGHVWYSTRSA